MWSFCFAIELRGAGLDINMPNPLVFDMPVEQSLKFMSSIGMYLLDTERERVDDMIDKMNCIFLGVVPRQQSVDKLAWLSKIQF